MNSPEANPDTTLAAETAELTPEQTYEHAVTAEVERMQGLIRRAGRANKTIGVELLRLTTDQHAVDGFIRHSAMMQLLDGEGLLDAYYGDDTTAVRREVETANGIEVEIQRKQAQGKKVGTFVVREADYKSNEEKAKRGKKKVGLLTFRFHPSKRIKTDSS